MRHVMKQNIKNTNYQNENYFRIEMSLGKMFNFCCNLQHSGATCHYNYYTFVKLFFIVRKVPGNFKFY